MKKSSAFIVILLISTFSIFAGVLPYSLPDDFSIDHLIMENYDLDVVGDSIEIHAPEGKIQKRDRIISSFQIPDIEEIDSWVVAYANTNENVSYTQTSRYISDVLGEGVSEKNTRFMIDRYSAEPSDEKIMSMLFSGEIGEYLCKAIPAMAMKQVILDAESEGISTEDIRLNMWKGEGISIYTIGLEGTNMIFYIHDGVVEEFISSALGILMLGALME